MARMLRGRHLANTHPQITQRLFQLGVIAILMHDTGYLKKRGDTEGTGAKYTFVHVIRSCAFAASYLPRVFTLVPWQDFAWGNLVLLLFGFWQSEGCAWNYDLRQKDKMQHLNDTWTPRDTLWLNVFLYIIAIALSWVSQDVLTVRG